MIPKTASTVVVVVASLLSAAHAFVPMKIEPLPSDFDTRIWSPLTTITPSPATALVSHQITAAPTPTPSTEEDVLSIQPVVDPNMNPELRKRQGVTQAVASLVTQISPITTYEINLYRSGTVIPMTVVYTQTFNAIPDQWPSPTLAGTIGLGTIQGTIGVVKSKRSLPTQAPLAELPESSPTEKRPSGEEDRLTRLIDKLRKSGHQISDEVASLVQKIKKPSLKEIEDEILALAYEIRLPTTKKESVEALEPTERFDRSQSEADDLHPEVDLHPQLRIAENDAQTLKKDIVAIVTVAIGALFLNYL